MNIALNGLCTWQGPECIGFCSMLIMYMLIYIYLLLCLNSFVTVGYGMKI